MNFYIDKIQKFFSSIAKYFSNSGYSFSWLFIIFMGAFALTTIVIIVSSVFSYEFMLTRAIEKINKFLTKNPRINDDNLIAFNNKMKEGGIPKILRRQWQQFMLYREHEASYYMSFQHCVENPIKNSTYRQQMSIYKVVSYVLVFLSLLLGVFCCYQSNFITILQDVLIIPVFILVLYYVISMILNLIHNATTSDLYQNYQYFEINIDKATVTLPEYVDYEVLFTQEEIKHGIPVLFEYIQKRAIEEQKELERARIKNVEHEKFNFEKSGLDASLVLERSMQEAENYIATRKKFMQDIEQVNNEINALENQYKENVKENQRLMQTSKETVDGLKKQLEQATSSIEINYIKKQMKDEINRQQIAERDFDALTDKFNKETKSLQSEVERLQGEIDSAKKDLESNMISEFSTYSTKIYNKVEEAVQKNEKEVIDDYKKQINDLEEKLALKDEELDNIYTQYQEQISNLEEKSKQFDSILKEKDDMISQAQDQLEMSKSKKSKKVEAQKPVDLQPVVEETFEPAEEFVAPQFEEPVNDNTVYEDADINFDTRLDDNYLVDNVTPTTEETFNFTDTEESQSNELESFNYLDETQNTEPAETFNYLNEEQNSESAESFNYLDNNSNQETFNYLDDNNNDAFANEDKAQAETFNYLDNEPQTQSAETFNYLSNDEPTSSADDLDDSDDDFLFDYTGEEPQDVDQEKAKIEEEELNSETGTEIKSNEDLDKLFDSWLSDEDDDSEGEDLVTPDETEEDTSEEVALEDEEDFSDADNEDDFNFDFVEDESEENVEEFDEIEDETEESADSNEIVEEEKPVRRVGRPRKVVSEEEIKPKRRVGRPRKVVTEEVTPVRRVGRPRKVVEEITEKRSVGRPRKVIEEAPIKRGVGRPKKVEVAPVRRVGRPRKEETTVEVKRSVGRPKKARPVGRPKKARPVGRPKKVEVEQVKKVGRPKKSTETVRKVGRPKAANPVGRPRKARPVGRPKKNKVGRPRQSQISEIDKQLNKLNRQIARESSNIAKTQKQLENVKLRKTNKK